MATRREIVRDTASRLCALYEPHEAEAIARELVERLLGISFSQLVSDYDAECNIDGLEAKVEELLQGRPIQYVTGVASFCDHDFAVREGVLIPRPETEELVAHVAAIARPHSRILDVGTGSGAIAISLALEIAESQVVGVDLSPVALEVASENASRLGANLTITKCDALGDMSHLGSFDIIVSNPPYIPHSDEPSMNKNVIDYEPHEALFVADDDALCFYRSIARNGAKMLTEGGWLWFEIYELYGEQMCQLLRDEGYRDVQLINDIFNKPRIVCGRR